MRALIAGAVLALALVAGAHAEDRLSPELAPVAACNITYQAALDGGRKDLERYHATMLDVVGEQKDKLLAAINAFPPATDQKADRILVFIGTSEDDGKKYSMVGFIINDCMTAKAQFTEDEWKKIVASAFGDAS